MDTKVDDKRIYEPVSQARRVKMKSDKANLMKKYQKMNMILNLKALHRDEYVKCIIQKIEIAKTMFIIEI